MKFLKMIEPGECVTWIEYDVTVHIFALQHGVCAGVRGCVHACAVEIKLGMLRAACFIDVRAWTRIWFALQEGGFHSKKGVIQFGLLKAKKISPENIQ